MRLWKKWLAAAGFALIFVGSGAARSRPFFLKNGDRVVFYGDSITEQRYYTVAVETYVRTRFPDLQVKFLNSAVGGATVIANWTAPVDLSLARDVFPFKPDVVTIMLGMNDGHYRPWDSAIARTYKDGYRHIIQSLQAHLPGVKIVLIRPTPWDDVTQPPSYPYHPGHAAGGYDSVISRYGRWLQKLGARDHLAVVDFHTPLIKLMEEAKQADPALAGKIIPGRIHPGASTELVMAQTLLKAWNAPATVSDVEINASASAVERSKNAQVTRLTAGPAGLAWTETDRALPYPIMTLHSTHWPQFPPGPWGKNEQIFWPLPPLESAQINPVAALVTKLTGMFQALDAETLRVRGLSGPSYQLKIDGQPVGTFGKDQLAQGINLARYDTPMMQQAGKVLTLVWHKVDLRFYGWRAIQVPLINHKIPGVQPAALNLLQSLQRQQNDLIRQAHAAAQPVAHHYQLAPAAP
jgi:lysophospholipase L1-like esterase